MRFSAPLVLLLAGSAQAFSSLQLQPRAAASSSLLHLSSETSAASATSFDKPPRIIREELPTLYVYDHCPFCVRVRVALGIKNIKHNLYFMANDDIPTPTALVGKKIAPIFVSQVKS